MEKKFVFEKQYLCLIGWFSPFLRSISDKKSLSFQRKLELPPVRFILPGAVFHGDGQKGDAGAFAMSLYKDYDPDESQDLPYYKKIYIVILAKARTSYP